MKSYNEAKKLTKADLLEEYKTLLEKYEDLESEYNSLDEWASENENSAYETNKKLEELTKQSKTNTNTTIVDVYDFKRRLGIENLLTEELDNFIENYLKYNNIL